MEAMLCNKLLFLSVPSHSLCADLHMEVMEPHYYMFIDIQGEKALLLSGIFTMQPYLILNFGVEHKAGKCYCYVPRKHKTKLKILKF